MKERLTRQMERAGAKWLAVMLGALWAGTLLFVAVEYVQLPVFALMPTIMTAFLAPGLILMLMVGRVTLRDDWQDVRSETDRRVLNETVAQLVLALCIWPAAAVILGGYGPGVIASLGVGFFVARLAFWIGAHHAPSLRVFGAAASFLPTVFVALWALRQLAFGFG